MVKKENSDSSNKPKQLINNPEVVEAMKVRNKKKKRLTNPYMVIALRMLLVTFGAVLMALSIKMFFMPANLIDGGITGISMMIYHETHFPLPILLGILNLPFIILGFKSIGKQFGFLTLYGIAILSVFTIVFEDIPALTDDKLLAALLGGIIIGLGVGIVIRTGGTLDGTEIVAVKLNEMTNFSVGQVILIANFFILSSASFVFTFESAMYSLLAYFIAFKVIDMVSEGGSEMKAVFISSSSYEAIGEALVHGMHRGITYINTQGGYSKADGKMLFTVVSRIEERKLKDIVLAIDENAFFVVCDAHDVSNAYGIKQHSH